MIAEKIQPEDCSKHNLPLLQPENSMGKPICKFYQTQMS